MALSTQEQILIEQRVTNEAKSVGVAYLLWLFVGGLGAHRFYLGRAGSGLVILILTIAGFMTLTVGVGLIFLGAMGLWVLIDAFLIPGLVQRHKADVRNRLTASALANPGQLLAYLRRGEARSGRVA
ncbi:TM2 domain-containing membrane protein YozV [Rhizobiales bacterium GAS191]|nr:TM2 domain-containing membrane protein YozV [Rhizobiales bacterium GAS191]